jgi:hypothetical protein
MLPATENTEAELNFVFVADDAFTLHKTYGSLFWQCNSVTVYVNVNK